MLEKILLEVCEMMNDSLNCDQMAKLKNVLFISFRDKTIVEEKCEIIPAETDEDMRLMTLFRASKLVAGRADGTLEQYIGELRYCRNSIGKSFKDITTIDLRWYLGMLQEQRGNKMSTIQNKIHYLNSFYSFLLNEGVISSNPVSRIETPKVEQTIRKAFSAEDMEGIRKCCSNVRDRALIEFLYSTGLRVSELVSLNVNDIDIVKKEFIVIGKGNKERTVYFSDVAAFHLRDYLRWRIQETGLTMEQIQEMPLFISTKKPFNRMQKPGIESLCRKIGNKAGIVNVHPHRFRRTFATNMMNHGMKIEELMKLMGHSKMDTTLIYCNVGQQNIKNSYVKCCA